jgi:thioredoxin-related protein
MEQKCKNTRLAIIGVAFVIFVAAPTFASSGGILWKSYEDGITAAKKESKKLMITFYADWCTYCKVMDRETFKDDAIVAYINRNFIPIRVNSDKERDTARTFKVRGLPDTWFMSENQEVIGHRAGFIPAETMMRVLKYINTDSYKDMSFKSFVDKK